MQAIVKSKYFRKVNKTFTFAPWSLTPNSDKHDLGALWALNGIADDEYVQISSADQRILFGAVVIGKKKVTLSQGKFLVCWSQAFGQDWECQDLFNHIHYVKTGTNLPNSASWEQC